MAGVGEAMGDGTFETMVARIGGAAISKKKHSGHDNLMTKHLYDWLMWYKNKPAHTKHLLFYIEKFNDANRKFMGKINSKFYSGGYF